MWSHELGKKLLENPDSYVMVLRPNSENDYTTVENLEFGEHNEVIIKHFGNIHNPFVFLIGKEIKE